VEILGTAFMAQHATITPVPSHLPSQPHSKQPANLLKAHLFRAPSSVAALAPPSTEKKLPCFPSQSITLGVLVFLPIPFFFPRTPPLPSHLRLIYQKTTCPTLRLFKLSKPSENHHPTSSIRPIMPGKSPNFAVSILA
jgi:hypothetical protein